MNYFPCAYTRQTLSRKDRVKAPSGARQRAFSDELALAADFRSALRRFLRRTEEIAAAHELTPQRYDLLLQIKASRDGNGRATPSALAERLALAQTAVSELLARAELAGLVERERDTRDGRVSWIQLTPEGDRRLMSMFVALRQEQTQFVEAFARVAGRLRALAAADRRHP
jgi:DNA-binding MarR family transcriptional regulator